MSLQSKNISKSGVIIGLSAVIVAVKNNEPKVFIVRGAEHALSVGVVPFNEDGDALPFGPFDPEKHNSLEIGLKEWVAEQTPIVPAYVEQLYSFANKGRYIGEEKEEKRVLSVGYLALTNQENIYNSDNVFFGDWYGYFPWEDWRAGKPRIIDDIIIPSLKRWIKASPSDEVKKDRTFRTDRCFAFDKAEWSEEKVLDRYELLYEAKLIYEAIRDKNIKVDYNLVSGRSMLYDHRRILATAIGRLRGKLKYRPVIFELMPDEFTLLYMQKMVEAVMGHSLHKQNFRRMVEASGMIEQIPNKLSKASGGRPAALFRFRRNMIL